MTRTRVSWVVVRIRGMWIACRADLPLARGAGVKVPHPTMIHALNDAQRLNSRRERA